jgi:hypothetical protein
VSHGGDHHVLRRSSALQTFVRSAEAGYASAGYASNARNLTQISFETDNVFSDGVEQQLATLTVQRHGRLRRALDRRRFRLSQSLAISAPQRTRRTISALAQQPRHRQRVARVGWYPWAVIENAQAKSPRLVPLEYDRHVPSTTRASSPSASRSFTVPPRLSPFRVQGAQVDLEGDTTDATPTHTR